MRTSRLELSAQAADQAVADIYATSIGWWLPPVKPRPNAGPAADPSGIQAHALRVSG